MPKEKKGILSVILNGDNPVKVSKKQAGKLRGFFKKIVDGLTTVPYIPGAIFEAAVERKKARKKDEEYVPFAERIEKKIKEAVETHKNENKETKKEDTVNDVNIDTNEEENVINENKETEVADG